MTRTPTTRRAYSMSKDTPEEFAERMRQIKARWQDVLDRLAAYDRGEPLPDRDKGHVDSPDKG